MMFTSEKVGLNVQLALKNILSSSENKELNFQSRLLMDQHKSRSVLISVLQYLGVCALFE